jgi:hypothetical protein
MSLGRHSHRWNNSINKGFKEIECEGVDLVRRESLCILIIFGVPMKLDRLLVDGYCYGVVSYKASQAMRQFF